MPEFGMQLCFGARGGEYQIYERQDGAFNGMDRDGNEVGVVWRRAYDDNEDLGQYFWPADMRAEYERLTGKAEFSPQEPPANIVEMVADPDECAFDQPCRFGHRVECHAIYCHNDGWLYAPRKCRRSKDPNDDFAQQKCPGFQPNEMQHV